MMKDYVFFVYVDLEKKKMPPRKPPPTAAVPKNQDRIAFYGTTATLDLEVARLFACTVSCLSLEAALLF